jgi:hypothetical protein
MLTVTGIAESEWQNILKRNTQEREEEPIENITNKLLFYTKPRAHGRYDSRQLVFFIYETFTFIHCFFLGSLLSN